MKPYAPAATSGPARPPLWGNEDRVRTLFGDRVTDLTARRQTVRMDHCANPTEFREYWKRNYRPDHRGLPVQPRTGPDGVEALDRDFLSFLHQRWNRETAPVPDRL